MCDSRCKLLHLLSAVCSLYSQHGITSPNVPLLSVFIFSLQLLKNRVSKPEKFQSLVTTLTLPRWQKWAVKKTIIKARQIYTFAKYHESCSFTQTQFSSIATTLGKQPSLPLSRWSLVFWIMTSSKSCIWMSALECFRKCSSHQSWRHWTLLRTLQCFHISVLNKSTFQSMILSFIWMYFGVMITRLISIIYQPLIIECFWLLKASLCQICNDVCGYCWL